MTSSTIPELTQRPEWQALRAHAERIGQKHLRELFAADPARGENFSAEAVGLYLDYSKQRVDDETLHLLRALAVACDLQGRTQAMFEGSKINVTEGRAVLHTALRTPRDAVVKVDGENVIPDVHAVLDRHGLVKRARERKNRALGTPLSAGASPNDLWCTDFKGEFKLGNGRYCYPVTVTDQASRYLLLCEALESTREAPVIEAFQELFRERGLPAAIRSDNGLPFASPNGLYNLSRLSVWWLRLGIAIERIKPGKPQQNGRHERMHLTLKKEATRPPGMNSLQQQARFDAFMREFNAERPHEALAMKCPAELYAASPRPYDGLQDVEYPFHDRDILVTACGRICMHRKKINISTVLAGQKLGLKEVDDGIWLVSFMRYDLGYIDLEQKTLQTIDNPFGTRLSPMS